MQSSSPGATPPFCALAPDQPDWASLNLIGQSPSFRRALALLQQCAGVDATVLIEGETGTGKELAARAIHYLSHRRGGPFVPVNCGVLPDTLMEAELFGHVRGAFTDAKAERRGLVGMAQGGTLFLDEIDALSPRAQSALLRFIQDHSYRPLGSARMEHADLRVLAATNADLAALASRGQFRQDLLFRLDVLSVHLPALRERGDDALLLAQAFVDRLVQQYRTPPRCLSSASMAELAMPQPWPGNVRELEHRVHRAFLLSGMGGPVNMLPDHEAGSTASADMPSATFARAKSQAIDAFERHYLADVLKRANGNLSLAARIAGKERSRFGKLVRKHGLERAAFGQPADK